MGFYGPPTPEANDLILIGDVDEIVGRQHWPKVLSGVQRQEAVAIRMLTTYYYINLLLSVDCTATKIYKFKVLKEKNLSGDGALVVFMGPASAIHLWYYKSIWLAFFLHWSRDIYP